MKTATILNPKDRLIRSLLAAGLLVGTAIIMIVPPAHLPIPDCVFHSLTGHSCMTCGLTRSLHALSRGEFAESLRLHLFGPMLFFGMIYCILLFAAEAVSGKKASMPKLRITKPMIALAAIAWVAYWASRFIAEIT